MFFFVYLQKLLILIDCCVMPALPPPPPFLLSHIPRRHFDTRATTSHAAPEVNVLSTVHRPGPAPSQLSFNWTHWPGG